MYPCNQAMYPKCNPQNPTWHDYGAAGSVATSRGSCSWWPCCSHFESGTWSCLSASRRAWPATRSRCSTTRTRPKAGMPRLLSVRSVSWRCWAPGPHYGAAEAHEEAQEGGLHAHHVRGGRDRQDQPGQDRTGLEADGDRLVRHHPAQSRGARLQYNAERRLQWLQSC